MAPKASAAAVRISAMLSGTILHSVIAGAQRYEPTAASTSPSVKIWERIFGFASPGA
jgi:hypothetical protein